MRVIDTTPDIDLSDPDCIESYWGDELIESLYFAPKKVSTDTQDAALAYERTGLETSELMEPLFYMFARIDFPVRTGYVFGYLAVRRYLQDQGLRTKDILGIDWRRVLCAQHEEKGQACS